jgi:transaldolase
LVQRGARPQRPLWASTGTKNPAYSDVVYVAELIGPDAVNTMPEATLEAFADHGRIAPTLAADPAAAERTLAAAAAAGVDLRRVGNQLERQGVDAFCESYRRVLGLMDAQLNRSNLGPGSRRTNVQLSSH